MAWSGQRPSWFLLGPKVLGELGPMGMGDILKNKFYTLISPDIYTTQKPMTLLN